jgi:phosphate-selective porin
VLTRCCERTSCGVLFSSCVGRVLSVLTALLVAAPTPVCAAHNGGIQVAPQVDAKPQKARKSEQKKKKKKKVDKPAPDETVDQADEPDAPKGGIRFTWKQHPSIRFGSVFRIDFEAKFQEDLRGSYEGVTDLDPWDLHRNRVGIRGNLFKQIEYEVEYELTEKELDAGETPKSHWKDVYLNVTSIKNAQVKIGKFKVPFGLDQLTGVTQNDFVYRSLGANYLDPARDIGVMVHGSFLRHGLEYSTGVFQHDGDNARSARIQGGDETFAARVTGTPFRRITRNLGEVVLGTAFTQSALSDDSFRPNGLRGRTVMTKDVFFEPVYVKGLRRRWEGDVDWTVGSASARAEYTLVSDDRERQGLGDDDLPNVQGHAWYVSGTWVVTGEKKTRPVKPAADFLRGGIGAIEIAGRYERLWFNSPDGTGPPFRNPRAEMVYPGGDKVLTLGVNWTLNRFMKVQFNGIRDHVEDVERNPVPGGAAFWSRVLRFQLVL